MLAGQAVSNINQSQETSLSAQVRLEAEEGKTEEEKQNSAAYQDNYMAKTLNEFKLKVSYFLITNKI